MANFLIDSVKTVITNAVVDKAASFIGIEGRTATNLIKTFLPALIGGVAHKGRNSSGAGDLMDMISKGGFGDNSISDLAGIFSDKSKSESFMKSGSDVLGGIFGNRQDGILETLMKGGGVKKGVASSLMSFLAPIVLSKIGSVIKNKGLDAIGLSKYLGEQKSSYASLVPGNMFSESTGAAASASSAASTGGGKSGGGGFLKWLLPLAIIGGLAYFLTKGGCNGTETAGTTDVKTESHEGHDHASHEGHDHGSHEGHDHGSHEGHNHGTKTTATSAGSAATAAASFTMNAAGDIMGADGKIAHKAGSFSIDDSGNLVDMAGNVISKAGQFGDKMLEGLRKTYGKLTGTKYMVDASGNLVDGSGKVLYKKGEFMEKDGYFVDKDGNRLGKILKKIGEMINKAVGAAGDAAKDASAAVGAAAAGAAGKFTSLFADMVAKKEGAESNYSLSDIKFNEENHRITSFSKGEVEGLAAALKANPDGKVVVSGSTKDRAKVVRDMLVTLGVKANQISAKKGADFDANKIDISVE